MTCLIDLKELGYDWIQPFDASTTEVRIIKWSSLRGYEVILTTPHKEVFGIIDNFYYDTPTGQKQAIWSAKALCDKVRNYIKEKAPV